MNEATTFVQFGVADVAKLIERGLTRASYLVGVIETLSVAEVEREDIETKIKTHAQSEVNGALGDMANPPALLLPSTEYKVTVDWEYSPCNKDGAFDADQEDWKAGLRSRSASGPIASHWRPAP